MMKKRPDSPYTPLLSEQESGAEGYMPIDGDMGEVSRLPDAGAASSAAEPVTMAGIAASQAAARTCQH
eukprot:5149283-Pyramimonas_sp.AAC.1